MNICSKEEELEYLFWTTFHVSHFLFVNWSCLHALRILSISLKLFVKIITEEGFEIKPRVLRLKKNNSVTQSCDKKLGFISLSAHFTVYLAENSLVLAPLGAPKAKT